MGDHAGGVRDPSDAPKVSYKGMKISTKLLISLQLL
jgi:hypothetical protein